MKLAGVVVLAPIGVLFALMCLLTGAAVVLSIPQALVHRVRRRRESRRAG